MMRRFSPFVTAAIGFALTLSLGACDKPKGTDKPGGEGGDGTTATAKEGGADYQYNAEGFTLSSTVKVKFEISASEGAGAAEMSARSLIEASPEGNNLKVHGKVVELMDYSGSGAMDPEFMAKQAEEQGGEAIDIVKELSNSESWMIVNLKGESEPELSKALAENQSGEDQGAARDFGLFALPDLPKVDLTEGKAIELPTEEDERQFPFGSVPVEVDQTWTLRGVSDEGGKRIAELDVMIEGSGATEIQGQGGTGMVSTLEESAYTIFFNLDDRIPVKISGYSASETTIDAGGQSFSFAVNNEIEASYEPGAPEPAAAPAEGEGEGEGEAAAEGDAEAPAEGAEGAPAEK